MSLKGSALGCLQTQSGLVEGTRGLSVGTPKPNFEWKALVGNANALYTSKHKLYNESYMYSKCGPVGRPHTHVFK